MNGEHTARQERPHASEYERFENARWERVKQPLTFRHIAAYELLEASGAPSFLDVGCGDGFFETYVRTKNPDFKSAGIDLSAVAITHARERVPGAEFRVADVAKDGIPYGDDTFEAVIALDVLEHLFTPEGLLREMVRVSSRYVVVGVPNFSSLPARIQMVFGSVPENNKPSRGHAYWFNHRILSKLLGDHGLSIREVQMNHQLMQMPLVGRLLAFLTRIFPNLFALSYVILAEKR